MNVVGNMAIEGAAVAYVIEQERLYGRIATDTRGRGPGDVESEGRIIEVKASSGQWRTGLLYFTPPQLREGALNEDYYVYIVENVGQGDPAEFDLHVLHGEDLRRLFASARPHRFYVPVRAADYARLTRLRVEGGPLGADDKNEEEDQRERKGSRERLTSASD